MKIIGVAGTDGSGKDSLGQMLAERHGWQFISVTDILRAEATKQNIRLGRDTLRQISAKWRRQDGLGVLVDKAVKMHKAQPEKFKGLVIASLRNPGEVTRMHELGGAVVWVDADPRVRYQRIKSRNRGKEDHVTFEEFLAEEKAQSAYQGDEATLNLSGVKDQADIVIENSGEDIEQFRSQAERSLKRYI